MKVLDIIFFLPASPHTKWEVKKNSQAKFATLYKLGSYAVLGTYSGTNLKTEKDFQNTEIQTQS